METAVAVLPELPGLGLQAVPAPVRRQWDVLVLELSLVLPDARVELVPRADHLALAGRPGGDLAAARRVRKY